LKERLSDIEEAWRVARDWTIDEIKRQSAAKDN